MSFHCPSSTCLGYTQSFSRRDMREQGDRCPHAMCGALLVKKVPTLSPQGARPVVSKTTVVVPPQATEEVLYYGCAPRPAFLEAVLAAPKLKMAPPVVDAMEVAYLRGVAAMEAEEKKLLRKEKAAVVARAKARRAARKAAKKQVAEMKATVALKLATRQKTARLSAAKRAMKAKRKAAKEAARLALEERRAAGLTRKSAFRRSLKKKATKMAGRKVPKTSTSTFPKVESFSCFPSSPLPAFIREEQPWVAVNTPCPHPEGFDLAVDPAFVAPIVGPIVSVPFMAPVVKAFNSLVEILAAINYEAAVDLRAYILEIASYENFFALRRIFVGKALSWMALILPLYPYAGIFDTYLPLDMVEDKNCDAYLASLQQTAVMVLEVTQGPMDAHSIFDIVRSVGSKVASIKDKVVGCIVEKSAALLDTVIDTAKGMFFGVLGPYLARAQKIGEEIKKFWDNCVEWATKLWQGAHIALQALGIYAVWAIVAMVLVGVMYILETILICLGVMSGHGVLVVALTGAVMTFLGFTVFQMGREYIHFLTALRQIIFLAVIPQGGLTQVNIMDSSVDVTEPHSLLDTAMAPVHFLETVASGLTFFSSTSVTVLGKLGNSLEGIRKGFNCLRDFTSVLLEQFGNAFEYISGKRTSFFRDLACAVKVDIARWTQDARETIEYFEISGSLDRYEYYRARELIYQGQDLIDTANKARSSHTSVKFLRTIGKLVEELKEIRAKCARSLKFPGWRRQPFWVYCFGESQCGKSTLANYLMPLLMSHMGWDPQDVYSKDPVDGYWSGYYQQKGLKINDLSAVNSKDVAPLEQQLIPLISTEEKMVSSAEIEGKGMQFASEIVVSSSNFNDAPTGAEILDADAYRQRRKVLMRCRRAAEWVHNADGTRTEKLDAEGKIVYKPYDPSNALSCTEVQWIHPVSFTALPGPCGQWHLAEFTIPMVKEAMDAHFLQEETKMASWKSSLGMKSQTARKMGSYLQDMIKGIGNFVTLKGAKDSDPRYLLVAVDGKCYALDQQGKATPYEDCDVVEEIERLTLLQYRSYFADLVMEHADNTYYQDSFHSSTVRDFLLALMKDGSTVLSVDSLGSSTQDIHKELWAELGLSEKIFLRVSQIARNQLRDAPHFKEDVAHNFLETMRHLRDAIVDRKEQILLFFAAVALVGLFSWGFLSLIKQFACGSLGFGAGIALREQIAHSSVMSSGSVTSAFVARNMPVVWGKAARYATAHSSKEEVGANFDYFEDASAHLLARVVGSSGQSETCLLFGHQAIALCAHQLRLFPDNDRVTIHYFSKERRPVCFSFTWHYINAIEWPDCEVIVYRDAQLTPLPVYSDDNYLCGEQTLPTVLTITGLSIKKKKFFDDSTLCPSEKILDGEMPIVRSWKDTASLRTQVQTILSETHRRDINRYYTSSYPSGKHDSGGIITAVINGKRKVIGMHCAGAQNGKIYVSTIGLLPTRNINDAHSAADYFVPSIGREEKGFCKIGWIADPSKRPHAATKTALAPVPKELALPLPEGVSVKIPSILSAADPRLRDEVNPEFKDYDPLRVGMDKFANPMDPLDDEVLQRVCEDIYETWYDCLPILDDEKVFLQKTSLEVALNGIPGEACYEAMRLDTSEGYPFVLERKPGESGKLSYVHIDENGVRSLIPGTSVFRDYHELSASILTQVPVLNCIECPKDELLKPSKVLEKPGTRLFDVLPFTHNILLREYFLNFCVFLQQNRVHLPCSVGVNPYSREWTWLFDRLAAKSDKALNCDYSKFDGLISHQVYMHMVATINRLFRDGEEANCARKNLFLMFTSRRSICYDQVYMVKGGMPSGCALTVIINSILNEILVRYVYRITVPMPAKNYFNKYVELVVYGDDNLIAIHDDVVSFFDGPIIKEKLAEVGVTITDGTDKSSPTLLRKPLESLDFLKRGFRKIEGGMYSCPLDKGSLYSRLYYSAGGKGGLFQLDILHDNVKSFLEELTHHADHYEEFQRVRSFYIKRIPSWSATLPTYATCLNMMEGQRNSATPWQPHKFIETRPSGCETKMMAGQDNHAQKICVTERIIICGEKYTPPILETSFVVSIDNPLYIGERGEYVKTEFGSGMGRLPTDAWIKAFSSPKKHPQLFEAYKMGATIYFRSCMPYLNAWCAVCKFALAHGIDQSSIIAMYESCKPRGAGDIAPLVAVKAYTKFVNRPVFKFKETVHKEVLEAHNSVRVA
ncbi:polyprotein [Soybean latent spherical virus]|uniref:RNA1 polyprotein n=1 Tax=Soybean latent spherical virus TaxID=1927714 RepID=A0A1L5JIX9_9SECO|nr:polyprotein [Soybean latent spherical virus]APO15117.1 polyprotein [Soybean latent spherical virus]